MIVRLCMPHVSSLHFLAGSIFIISCCARFFLSRTCMRMCFFFILSQCRSQQNSDIICLKQAKINATALQRFCWFSNDVNVLANNVAWNEFDLIWYLLSDGSRLTATTKNHEKSSLKLIACFPPDAQYKLSICCTRGCFSE